MTCAKFTNKRIVELLRIKFKINFVQRIQAKKGFGELSSKNIRIFVCEIELWTSAVDTSLRLFQTAWNPRTRTEGRGWTSKSWSNLCSELGPKLFHQTGRREHIFSFIFTHLTKTIIKKIVIRRHRFFAFTGFYSELSTHRFSKYLYISQ